MTVPQQVLDLIQRFTDNRAAYHSGQDATGEGRAPAADRGDRSRDRCARV